MKNKVSVQSYINLKQKIFKQKNKNKFSFINMYNLVEEKRVGEDRILGKCVHGDDDSFNFVHKKLQQNKNQRKKLFSELYEPSFYFHNKLEAAMDFCLNSSVLVLYCDKNI